MTLLRIKVLNAFLGQLTLHGNRSRALRILNFVLLNLKYKRRFFLEKTTGENVVYDSITRLCNIVESLKLPVRLKSKFMSGRMISGSKLKVPSFFLTEDQAINFIVGVICYNAFKQAGVYGLEKKLLREITLIEQGKGLTLLWLQLYKKDILYNRLNLRKRSSNSLFSKKLKSINFLVNKRFKLINSKRSKSYRRIVLKLRKKKTKFDFLKHVKFSRKFSVFRLFFSRFKHFNFRFKNKLKRLKMIKKKKMEHRVPKRMIQRAINVLTARMLRNKKLHKQRLKFIENEYKDDLRKSSEKAAINILDSHKNDYISNTKQQDKDNKNLNVAIASKRYDNRKKNESKEKVIIPSNNSNKNRYYNNKNYNNKYSNKRQAVIPSDNKNKKRYYNKKYENKFQSVNTSKNNAKNNFYNEKYDNNKQVKNASKRYDNNNKRYDNPNKFNAKYDNNKGNMKSYNNKIKNQKYDVKNEGYIKSPSKYNKQNQNSKENFIKQNNTKPLGFKFKNKHKKKV